MCSNPINQDGSNLPLSNWAGLERAGLERAESVRAGSVRAGSVRAGLVRVGLIRAGLVRAKSVGAGSEPAPTAAIHDYLEPAPTAEIRDYLEPATMCSNPINQDGSYLPLSNWAGLVRAESVGAGSEPAPTAATHDYPEPAPTTAIHAYSEPAPTAVIDEYPEHAATFANIIKLDSSGIGSSLGMPW